jgi:hypothetical protein
VFETADLSQVARRALDRLSSDRFLVPPLWWLRNRVLD